MNLPDRPPPDADRADLLAQLGVLCGVMASHGWTPVIPLDVAADLFPTSDLPDLIDATKDRILAIIRAEDEGTPR